MKISKKKVYPAHKSMEMDSESPSCVGSSTVEYL